MMRGPLCIVILSFNRPHYLQQVLDSLASQIRPGDRLILAQDGRFNDFSKKYKSDERAIDDSIYAFRRKFPDADVLYDERNHGIAGNYRRTERLVFEKMGFSEAVFLEDDLILSPNYLDVTWDLLRVAAGSERIGYVAAYGGLWLSLPDQFAGEAHNVCPMHENWGSAYTRRAWAKQREFRDEYWALIDQADYSERDDALIQDFYQRLGYRSALTSQDFSRWVACSRAGLARITTRTCQAKYIGREGAHSVPEYFDRMGFAQTIMFPRRPIVAAPRDDELDEWIAAEREALMRGYRHPYEGDAES